MARKKNSKKITKSISSAASKSTRASAKNGKKHSVVVLLDSHYIGLLDRECKRVESEATLPMKVSRVTLAKGIIRAHLDKK